MDLFRMRCLVSAARTMNFTQTARELFVTQSAVTQQIAAIEEELGVRLFIRKGHNLTLTPAGKFLANGFEGMLYTYNGLCAQAKSLDKLGNEIRIGYHGPLGWGKMYEVIHSFREKNPGCTINIRTDHWGTLIHDLSMGFLDVVFTEEHEMLEHPELEYMELFTEGACVCMANTYPLASHDELSASQLTGTIIMTTSPKPSKSMDSIISGLKRNGVDMDHATYVNQFETAIVMAGAGMGITILPRSFKAYSDTALKYVDLDLPEFTMSMGVAYSETSMNPLTEKFIQLCAEWEW